MRRERLSSVCIFTTLFVRQKCRPREQRHVQVDRARIERIDRRIQIGECGVVRTQFPRLLNEHLGELGADAPVAVFVCVRKVIARYGAVYAHVVKLGFHRPQASFDVPQALSVGQLGKSYHPEMLGACKRPS